MLASSNESVTPPHTHLSKHVEWWNFIHTHAHAHIYLRSAIISLSQLGLFVVPLPSIPHSCVWPHLITAAVSLCLTASHSVVRSHLTTDFVSAHLFFLCVSSAAGPLSCLVEVVYLCRNCLFSHLHIDTRLKEASCRTTGTIKYVKPSI